MHVLCCLINNKTSVLFNFYVLGSELIKANDWFTWSRWRAADVCIYSCVCACVRACVRVCVVLCCVVLCCLCMCVLKCVSVLFLALIFSTSLIYLQNNGCFLFGWAYCYLLDFPTGTVKLYH